MRSEDTDEIGAPAADKTIDSNEQNQPAADNKNARNPFNSSSLWRGIQHLQMPFTGVTTKMQSVMLRWPTWEGFLADTKMKDTTISQSNKEGSADTTVDNTIDLNSQGQLAEPPEVIASSSTGLLWSSFTYIQRPVTGAATMLMSALRPWSNWTSSNNSSDAALSNAEESNENAKEESWLYWLPSYSSLTSTSGWMLNASKEEIQKYFSAIEKKLQGERVSKAREMASSTISHTTPIALQMVITAYLSELMKAKGNDSVINGLSSIVSSHYKPILGTAAMEIFRQVQGDESTRKQVSYSDIASAVASVAIVATLNASGIPLSGYLTPAAVTKMSKATLQAVQESESMKNIFAKTGLQNDSKL